MSTNTDARVVNPRPAGLYGHGEEQASSYVERQAM